MLEYLARQGACGDAAGGLAVEGAAVLWADPEIALDGYAGLTVLAGALVTAALLYVGYLTVVDST